MGAISLDYEVPYYISHQRNTSCVERWLRGISVLVNLMYIGRQGAMFSKFRGTHDRGFAPCQVLNHGRGDLETSVKLSLGNMLVFMRSYILCRLLITWCLSSTWVGNNRGLAALLASYCHSS